MDSALPSYETAMRDAREYLRRRDLTSQDEIPLYFAWERLYAAANANLSTDFLNETRAELRARQQARLTPRQGLPPPLFTSFDKVNRKSLQSSAFLRSGLSSDAAIEMMARRYRREAEKLRSSREKLVVSSIGGAGKRLKKGKRGKKTPQDEVGELLEDLESPRSPRRSEFGTGKLAKSGLETASDDGGNRTKKINRNRPNPEREVEELLAKFENANTIRNRDNAVKHKGGVDFSGGKDSFADELAGGDVGKAAELRRSSFSMRNPAADPSRVNVEDVAAFAAKVSDWRMHPSADTAALSSKLGHSGSASNGLAATTKGTKRIYGVGKVRKSAGVGGFEVDTTFDTSLGSSGSDEDHLDANGSIRSSAVSTSPTRRRSTAHTTHWVDDVDENEQLGDEQGVVRNSATDETPQGQPTVDAASNSKPLHSRPGNHAAVVSSTSGAGQRPAELSHAVGDMHVKIKGKEIEITFRGSLDDSNSADVKNTKLQSERIHLRGQPSATQKVFGTADTTSRRGSDKEDDHGIAQQAAQMRNAAAPSDVNIPRQQSSVRFSGVADDDVDETTNEDRGPRQNERKPLEDRDAPVASVLGRQELPLQRVRSAGGHSSAATQDAAAEESLYNNGETVELDDRSNMNKLRRQQDDARETRPHDNGNSRASTSRSESLNPTSGGHNGEFTEEHRGRHREDSEPRKRVAQAGSKRSNSHSETADQSPDSEPSHLQDDIITPSVEFDSGGDECESEEQTIAERHSRNERGIRRSSQYNSRSDIARQETTVKQTSSSESQGNFEFNEELSDDESDIGTSEEPKRGHEDLESRKQRSYRSGNASAEMSSEEEGVGIAQANQPRDNKRAQSSRRSRNQQQSDQLRRGSGMTPSTKETRARANKRAHSSQRSRSQQVLVEDSDVDSDEDFSDGPDISGIEYHHHKSKHDSSQLQRRTPHDDRVYAGHGRSRRSSSRPPSSRHTSSRNKQRSHSSDSSSDSSSDYASRSEVQRYDRRHRADPAERPRSKRSSTRDRQRPSTRYSANALRDRDHHLAAAMESPPKRSKSREIRSKQIQQTKTKLDSKSSKSTPKLPEGIVWPPGMEAECIARLGLDGHHPIAPPGLEHLVTDEQWGDYWTWLHWYSSWQMWYMKNGKKPKRSSEKEKRRGRQHTDSDESLDNEPDRRHKKSQRNNTNWWVDVGPTKNRRHRSRS